MSIMSLDNTKYTEHTKDHKISSGFSYIKIVIWWTNKMCTNENA